MYCVCMSAYALVCAKLDAGRVQVVMAVLVLTMVKLHRRAYHRNKIEMTRLLLLLLMSWVSAVSA